jgi:hypothetical protein
MQDMIQMAAQFVNNTSSHIFLTGKAGTGKTTFLRSLGEKTHKRFLIVAPTGIAALNAGGVTIHSQFLLPLGTFLPDKSPSGNFSDQSHIYTQYTLTRKHPLNSIRRQVLRSIDLLIIDEVSMLRADVLDAIDYRLRSARGNFRQSFGGVQVLLIGDLYQLPPIVREHEWTYLKRYYHSAHFFEAKALQEDGFAFLELNKIFRQSDDRFISILNNLRDNKVTPQDIEELNKHYQPQADVSDRVITLTTHNYKADEINQRALAKLPGRSETFYAEVENDFPETIYPLPAALELKVGAQLMFIKNDTSGNSRYFNGKLATVTDLDEDGIMVELADSGGRYRLEKELWENKRYKINGSTKELDEEVIGTFSHYPVKLAWAVTVHKSQGLTFDKAVIDVGSAFAPGQVYVALSRLKSLDGLILKTRIDPGTINSDALVVEFSNRKNLQGELSDMLREKQIHYAMDLIENNFDFSLLVKEINKCDQDDDASMEFEDESMRGVLKNLADVLKSEEGNTLRFRQQLKSLLSERRNEQLLERLSKGTEYYLALLKRSNKQLLQHIQQVGRYSGQKSYLNALTEVDQLFSTKIESVQRTQQIIGMIISGQPWTEAERLRNDQISERLRWLDELKSQSTEPIRSKRKSGKLKKGKAVGGKKSSGGESTIDKTIALLKNGLNIEQIAAERGLVSGTIEGHLMKATTEQKITLADWISAEEIEEIEGVLKRGSADETITAIHQALGGKISYGKIRAVSAVLRGEDVGSPS